VDDYKHFLPRILELVALGEPFTGNFVAAGKLESAAWRSWPRREKESLVQFLSAYWRVTVATTPDYTEDAEDLCAVADGPWRTHRRDDVDG
jgi:hypothetical protein